MMGCYSFHGCTKKARSATLEKNFGPNDLLPPMEFIGSGFERIYGQEKKSSSKQSVFVDRNGYIFIQHNV